MLVPTNESKEKYLKKYKKKYEELWSKIRELNMKYQIYIKIRFNLDDELPLNKTIEIPSTIIVVRAIFLESNKHYPQVLLDECLYKI